MKKFIIVYLVHLRLFSKNAKLFLFGGIFNGIGLSVFSLLFNLYLKEHGFTESQIGQILSWGSLGSALVAIPAAMLLERVHVKKILIYSTVLACLAYFFSIFSKTLSLIFIFMFFANSFITVYRVSIAPFFMRNSTKSERIYLFSVSSALSMLSQLFGFIIGGYLPKLVLFTKLTDNLSLAYEIALYISIVGTMVSIFPFLFIKQAEIPKNPTNMFAKIKGYNWPIISRLMIPKVLVGFGAGLVIPFMNLYFKNEYNLESETIGFFFSVMQVFLFIGMMSAPYITKKFGMMQSIVLTELLSIPFMFILAMSRYLPLAVIAFIMRGTLMNMNLPISSNFEMELVKPNEQSFTNAISTLGWQGAWTVSAWAGGQIIEKYSFEFSFYVTILAYFLSAVTYYIFFKKKPINAHN
ncbi:MAG TPA: MFS transporter [Candidatus Cloacimonadota bacterium]|jgi:predicted MFS family arabinose efflux permease|nr:MFS transporter [Candidatus Cloacimonadales bacterium]HPY95910.1 MFS transporter [Candidatus Cloacimonadota bacterium]HQB40909.1 MFS transporter [Candidatus Cloacimonadota bacterium]